MIHITQLCRLHVCQPTQVNDSLHVYMSTQVQSMIHYMCVNTTQVNDSQHVNTTQCQ